MCVPMNSCGFRPKLYNVAAVLCPLCGTRRAKRGCPALGKQICTVCCGTKRLTEIQCPADCAFLGNAREHPAATLVRQQRRDVSLVMQFVRDFSDRQSQLFLMIAAFLQRAPSIVDADIADAMHALASTYETAVRGVIYEHRPTGLPAQRLVTDLKPLLNDAGKNGGTAFERDAAVVMRRVDQAIVDARAADPENPRAFAELLMRVLPQGDEAEPPANRLYL